MGNKKLQTSLLPLKKSNNLHKRLKKPQLTASSNKKRLYTLYNGTNGGARFVMAAQITNISSS